MAKVIPTDPTASEVRDLTLQQPGPGAPGEGINSTGEAKLPVDTPEDIYADPTGKEQRQRPVPKISDKTMSNIMASVPPSTLSDVIVNSDNDKVIDTSDQADPWILPTYPKECKIKYSFKEHEAIALMRGEILSPGAYFELRRRITNNEMKKILDQVELAKIEKEITSTIAREALEKLKTPAAPAEEKTKEIEKEKITKTKIEKEKIEKDMEELRDVLASDGSSTASDDSKKGKGRKTDRRKATDPRSSTKSEDAPAKEKVPFDAKYTVPTTVLMSIKARHREITIGFGISKRQASYLSEHYPGYRITVLSYNSHPHAITAAVRNIAEIAAYKIAQEVADPYPSTKIWNVHGSPNRFHTIGAKDVHTCHRIATAYDQFKESNFKADPEEWCSEKWQDCFCNVFSVALLLYSAQDIGPDELLHLLDKTESGTAIVVDHAYSGAKGLLHDEETKYYIDLDMNMHVVVEGNEHEYVFKNNIWLHDGYYTDLKTAMCWGKVENHKDFCIYKFVKCKVGLKQAPAYRMSFDAGLRVTDRICELENPYTAHVHSSPLNKYLPLFEVQALPTAKVFSYFNTMVLIDYGAKRPLVIPKNLITELSTKIIHMPRIGDKGVTFDSLRGAALQIANKHTLTPEEKREFLTYGVPFAFASNIENEIAAFHVNITQNETMMRYQAELLKFNPMSWWSQFNVNVLSSYFLTNVFVAIAMIYTFYRGVRMVYTIEGANSRVITNLKKYLFGKGNSAQGMSLINLPVILRRLWNLVMLYWHRSFIVAGALVAMPDICCREVPLSKMRKDAKLSYDDLPECKEHEISKMLLGVKERPVVYPRNCSHNALLSITNRFLLEEKGRTKDTPDWMWRFEEFVMKKFFPTVLEGDKVDHIPLITIANHPQYFAQWNAKYTLSKRMVNAIAYWQIYRAGRPYKMKRLKQCFVKMETHSASDGHVVEQFVPRPIQATPIQYQVQLGPINAQILEWAKHTFSTGLDQYGNLTLRHPHIVIGCNLTIQAMGLLHDGAVKQGLKIQYDGDCNRMDGHQSYDLNSVVMMLYKVLGVEDVYVDLMDEQYSLAGIINRVIWFIRFGGMNSGSPETYIANTILMICLYLWALDYVEKRSKSKNRIAKNTMAWISGDDLDIFSRYKIDTIAFNKAFELLCMDIELKEVSDNAFCQMVPYQKQDTIIYGPKPGRVIARTFWLHPKHGAYYHEKADALEHMRAICLGLKQVSNHVPVLRAIVQTVIEKTRGVWANTEPFYDKYKIGSYEGRIETADITTLQHFAQRYDIDVPAIVDCERWIENNMKIGSFLTHSVISKIVAHDLPMKGKPVMEAGEMYLRNWPKPPLLNAIFDICYYHAKTKEGASRASIKRLYQHLKLFCDAYGNEYAQELRKTLFTPEQAAAVVEIKLPENTWRAMSEELKYIARVEGMELEGPLLSVWSSLRHKLSYVFGIMSGPSNPQGMNAAFDICYYFSKSQKYVDYLDVRRFYKFIKKIISDHGEEYLQRYRDQMCTPERMDEAFATVVPQKRWAGISEELAEIGRDQGMKFTGPIMSAWGEIKGFGTDAWNFAKNMWSKAPPLIVNVPDTVIAGSEDLLAAAGAGEVPKMINPDIVGPALKVLGGQIAETTIKSIPQEKMSENAITNFFMNRWRVMISNSELIYSQVDIKPGWYEHASLMAGNCVIAPLWEEAICRAHWLVPHIFGILEFGRNGFFGWFLHWALSKLKYSTAVKLHGLYNLLAMSFFDSRRTLSLFKSPISSFITLIVISAVAMQNAKEKSKATEVAKLKQLGQIINQRIAQRTSTTGRGRETDRDVDRSVSSTRSNSGTRQQQAPGTPSRSKSAERSRTPRRSRSRSRSRGYSADGRRFARKYRRGGRRRSGHRNRALPSKHVVTPPPLPPRPSQAMSTKRVDFAPRSILKRTEDVPVFTKRELSSTSIVNRQGQDSIIERDIQIVLPNDIYCASTDIRGQVYTVLPITPALLAPQTRIELDAKEYDKFEVLSIQFGFQSVVGSNQSGAILLLYDPDPTDITETVGFTLNLQAATDTRVKKVIQVQGNPDEDNWTPKIKMQSGEPAMFTSTTSGHTAAETSYGALIVACETPTASSNTLMGQLVIRMSLRFFDHYNEGQQDMFVQEGAAPVSTSSLFAATNTKYGWMVNFISALNNVVTYVAPGRYLMVVLYSAAVSDTNTVTFTNPSGTTTTAYSTVYGHSGVNSIIFVTFDLGGSISRITPVTATINGVANANGFVKIFSCRLDGGNVPDTLANLMSTESERISILEKKIAKLIGDKNPDINHSYTAYMNYQAYANVISKYGMQAVTSMDDKTVRWAMREFIPRDLVLPGQTYDEIYDYQIKFAIKNGGDPSAYKKPVIMQLKDTCEPQSVLYYGEDRKQLLLNLKNDVTKNVDAPNKKPNQQSKEEDDDNTGAALIWNAPKGPNKLTQRRADSNSSH